MELDEMWSVVGKNTKKQWLWLAFDRQAKKIVGWHVGKRSKEDARQLWASLPGVYRQCAVCYTDFWEAYAKVLPSYRHRPVGKNRGETSHIEPDERHISAKRLSSGAQDVIVFKEHHESLSSHQVFHLAV